MNSALSLAHPYLFLLYFRTFSKLPQSWIEFMFQGDLQPLKDRSCWLREALSTLVRALLESSGATASLLAHQLAFPPFLSHSPCSLPHSCSSYHCPSKLLHPGPCQVLLSRNPKTNAAMLKCGYAVKSQMIDSLERCCKCCFDRTLS